MTSGHLSDMVKDRLAMESYRSAISRAEGRLSRSYLNDLVKQGLTRFPDPEQFEGLARVLRIPVPQVIRAALLEWTGTTLIDAPNMPPIGLPAGDLTEEDRAAWLRHATEVLRRLSEQ